jgi:hypothetical protein
MDAVGSDNETKGASGSKQAHSTEYHQHGQKNGLL